MKNLINKLTNAAIDATIYAAYVLPVVIVAIAAYAFICCR